MIFVAIAVYLGSLVFLGAFYYSVYTGTMRNSARLPMTLPETLTEPIPQTYRTSRTKKFDIVRSTEWARFCVEYLAFLAVICTLLACWIFFRNQITQGIQELYGQRIDTLSVPLNNSSSIYFAVVILMSMLATFAIWQRNFRQSISYPFIATHAFILIAAALADILGLNSELNPARFLHSATNSVVVLVFISHALWAITYPRPIARSAYVVIAFLFAIVTALIFFLLAQTVIAMNTPTLSNIYIYMAFGHGVFGTHVWSIAYMSQSSL